MKLRPGARLVVKVSRSGLSSRVLTYVMVRLKAPKQTRRCQDPGLTQTQRC